MVRDDVPWTPEDRYVQQAAKRRVPTEDQALHAPLVSQRPKLHSDRQTQTPAAADASADGSQAWVAPVEIFFAAAFTPCPPQQAPHQDPRPPSAHAHVPTLPALAATLTAFMGPVPTRTTANRISRVWLNPTRHQNTHTILLCYFYSSFF